MNSQSTRASSGYALRGIATHETLTAPRRYTHHQPEHYGGLSFGAAVVLMAAGAVGTVWVVEVIKMAWVF